MLIQRPCRPGPTPSQPQHTKADCMAIQKWSSSLLRSLTALALSSLIPAQQALAWGVDGHHMINRLAGINLPGDVPSFLRSPEGLSSLEYYAPEPDHWRGRAEPQLANESSPDHFIALERVAMLGQLPRNRYDYVRALVP